LYERWEVDRQTGPLLSNFRYRRFTAVIGKIAVFVHEAVFWCAMEAEAGAGPTSGLLKITGQSV
jgi:hypothetical protein